MTTVVTAAEIYSPVDVERAVAEVTRVGGGMYQFRSFDGVHSDTFPDFVGAVAAAEEYAVYLDTPAGKAATTAHAASLAAQMEQLRTAHAAEIESLTAQRSSG